MISEAIGKILGMAMAYGVSALGLLLAYVNYRRRIVKAERLFSGTAWVVIVAVLAVVALGVWTVGDLARRGAEQAAAAATAGETAAAGETEAAGEPPVATPQPTAPVAAAAPGDQLQRDKGRWAVGIWIPAVIFLFATWVTFALHRHFSRIASDLVPDRPLPPGEGGPPGAAGSAG